MNTGRALTIGNFDGVHAGHQKLIDRVNVIAREHGLTSAAVTFDPHPTKLLAPGRAPKLLMSLEARIAQMKRYGLDEVMCLPFDLQMATLSPDQFAQLILRDTLNAKAVVVGDNFRFGHKQAGDVEALAQLGEKYGFITQAISAVVVRARIASSSAIRQLLADGEVSKACRLLNRPFSVEGEIVSGHGIGSKQTVPTLNLATTAEVLPANGVYVTSTLLPGDDKPAPSITNIGMRPTFGGDKLSIETFLLGPLITPPANITLLFHRRVRDERQFPSPELLRAQIMKDVERANTFWRRLKPASAIINANPL
jgi:riboflavin kinase / FMN adenylyltransferase